MKITRVERNHLGTILTAAAVVFLVILILVVPLSTKTVTEEKEVIVTEEISVIVPTNVSLSDINFQMTELSETENETHVFTLYSLETDEKMTGCFYFVYTFRDDRNTLTTCLNNENKKAVLFQEERIKGIKYKFKLLEPPEIIKLEEKTKYVNKTTTVNETKVVSTNLLDI